MVYTAYFTELILQISNMRKNDAFDAKIINTRLTKIVIAPDERLPSSSTLVLNTLLKLVTLFTQQKGYYAFTYNMAM